MRHGPNHSARVGELRLRHRQVLLLASHGLTNREIATSLGLSEETVKSYKSELLLRLNARNTAHAVALAYRRGLLNPHTR